MSFALYTRRARVALDRLTVEERVARHPELEAEDRRFKCSNWFLGVLQSLLVEAGIPENDVGRIDWGGRDPDAEIASRCAKALAEHLREDPEATIAGALQAHGSIELDAEAMDDTLAFVQRFASFLSHAADERGVAVR